MRLSKALEQKCLALAKPTEASFTRGVVRMAQLFRWHVVHWDTGRGRSGKWITPYLGDGKGFPDVVALRGDALLVAELKVPPNKATPEQLDWLDRFRAVGAGAYLWTPDSWAEIEAVLRG